MVRRIIQIAIGLFFYGAGISFLIRSDLGASSWDVLTQGISHHVPLSFGTITIIISGVVLLLWSPIKQKPGIGTILNAVLIGPSADICLAILPEVHTMWLRVAFVALGIITVGMATGLYIGSRFGPGPRDGLMTGLNKLTGYAIWKVRLAIELVVLAIGWMLGGTVGIGTVAFAVFIGYVCQFSMPLFNIILPSDRPVGPVADDIDEAELRSQESPARI